MPSGYIVFKYRREMLEHDMMLCLSLLNSVELAIIFNVMFIILLPIKSQYVYYAHRYTYKIVRFILDYHYSRSSHLSSVIPRRTHLYIR